MLEGAREKKVPDTALPGNDFAGNSQERAIKRSGYVTVVGSAAIRMI